VNILSFIGEIFKPAAKLIDDLHTSDEEKLTLKNKLTVIQNEMHSKVIDYETKLLASQSSIIIAEASGQSWMQRSWRPITMLTFLGLVVCDSFGWLANPLAAEAWTLLQIGLGGYVTGRSIEKVAVKLKPK
tara:strand:+ start:392 stop:784 length:393 start_codon:yes stop_codon:yes gene_type:complete